MRPLPSARHTISGPGMMFETISLHEPDKSVVHGFTAGPSFPREAFVCAFDRTNGQVFEARVDLVGDRVVDWRHVPGVRPRILIDDITLVGEVARADPRFRAALAKRGIADFENVQVDPWSAGNYGLPDEEGRRLCHTFCWYRSEKNDNPYAHPIEGLCAVVDLDRAEVLRIDDHGAADVPREDRNYAARYRTVYPRRREAAGDHAAGRARASRSRATRCAGRSGACGSASTPARGWCCTPSATRTAAGAARAVSRVAARWSCPTAIPARHFRKNAFDVGEYGMGMWPTR